MIVALSKSPQAKSELALLINTWKAVVALDHAKSAYLVSVGGISERAHQALVVTLLVALAVSLSVLVLGQTPGEQAVDRLCDQKTIVGGVRLEVFMDVHATPEEVDSVERFLNDSSQVRRFEVLDKDAAFEEFKRIFRKDTDLVNNIDPESLPTSFRVVPDDVEDARPQARKVGKFSGVDDAVTPDRALEELCNL